MGGLACSGPRWGGAAGTLQAVSAVTLGVPGVPESTHMPSAWILKRGPLPTVRKKSRGLVCLVRSHWQVVRTVTVRARLIPQGRAPRRDTQHRKIKAAPWENRESEAALDTGRARPAAGTARVGTAQVGTARAGTAQAGTVHSWRGWLQVFLPLLPGHGRWGHGEGGGQGSRALGA